MEGGVKRGPRPLSPENHLGRRGERRGDWPIVVFRVTVEGETLQERERIGGGGRGLEEEGGDWRRSELVEVMAELLLLLLS